MLHVMTKKGLVERKRKKGGINANGGIVLLLLSCFPLLLWFLITRFQPTCPRYAMPSHARPFHPFFTQ